MGPEGEAMAFELEAKDDARLDFRLRYGPFTQERHLSPRGILNGATVAFMQDLPPGINDGAAWRLLDTHTRFKVHQGWSLEALTVDLSLRDDEASRNRTDFYYVRLMQRNNQRAWSSPIWVEP